MCAVSDKSALIHENAKVGDSLIFPKIRRKLIKELIKRFKYPQLIITKPDYVKNMYKKYIIRDKLFILNDSIWEDSLSWQ